MTQPIGIQTRLKTSYDDAISQVTAALKAEGFGVLTEIDVQSTLKNKIGADFRKYKILGACNPNLAHKALSGNLDVGLLLPCNVIVYEDGTETVVSAVDPIAMLGVLAGDASAAEVATQAKEKLTRAIRSLS